MKKLSFQISIIMLIGVLTFIGCKKDDPDPCESVTCQNGGTCSNGTCNCPTGFSGTFCEIADPCFNVTCLNGGTCANGTCICTQGYTGTNCGTEITPTTITLTKITVDEFPPLDNGGNWDGFGCGVSFPDVKIGIGKSSSSFYIWVSTINSDAVPGTSYIRTVGLPITFNSPTSSHDLDMIDNDTGACAPDDFMGRVQFVPYQSGQGFPSTIRVYSSTKEIDVTLHITYTW